VPRQPILIDVARVAAIVAGVGILYSPTAATIGLIVTYVAFLASGKEALFRFKAVIERPLGYWGLIFLGAVVIGMSYASVPWHDRWLDLYKWRTILWMFVVLALFGETCWKERFFMMFLGGTGVAVVASFFAAISGVVLWRGGAQALLRNSGTQGMAFACAALVCVWMVVEKKHIGLKPWVLSMLGLLYVLNIVFVTNSRSGYAVLGCGLAIILLRNASLKQGTLMLSGLFIAAGLAFTVSPRMQGIVTDGVAQWANESESDNLTNFGSRRVYYRNSVEILQEHWIVGVGTGGFAQAYGDKVAKKYDASDWRALVIKDPHNQYLGVAIQQGIGGVALFLAWIAAIVRERDASKDHHRLAVAILVGWCVTSLFSSHFKTFAEGHLLAMFLGVLLAIEGGPVKVQAVPVRSTQASAAS
jgi:O-antigen ligase